MDLRDFLIRLVRKLYMLVTNKKFENPPCILDRQLVNDKIYNLLVSDQPCMISRFGTTELITVNNYVSIISNKPLYRKIWNFISDKTHTPWWFKGNFQYMSTFSGVFPPTQETMENFSRRYLKDIPLIDILGSFQYYEKFMPLHNNVEFVHLETLYPFFVKNPWTVALKGKKVLIVHPFEDSILHQYKQRHFVFRDSNILPDFDLTILKAIQSVGGNDVDFKNWFEALAFMEDKISKIDFDICLLGCGAYGLPLAAYIKRMGKKAIHIGGGLQLLFGIKGKRWDDDNYGWEYNLPELMKIPYNSLYNNYWIKALATDIPQNIEKVDGGVYW